jgi:hypothetical protein
MTDLFAQTPPELPSAARDRPLADLLRPTDLGQSRC